MENSLKTISAQGLISTQGRKSLEIFYSEHYNYALLCIKIKIELTKICAFLKNNNRTGSNKLTQGGFFSQQDLKKSLTANKSKV